MNKTTIGQAELLTSPNPFAIITSLKPDGETNAMACSWWCYASNHPATVVICLSQKGYTGECIRNQGVFGVNIVSAAVKEAAFACGTVSGRTGNKAEATGLPLVEAEGHSQKMVEHSRLWMSCRLVNCVEAGDHMLYVGEVTAIEGDAELPAVYAWNGYGKLAEAVEG